MKKNCFVVMAGLFSACNNKTAKDTGENDYGILHSKKDILMAS